MKIGRIIEGFSVLPSLSINWITFCGERHYSIQFAWLWWYISTYKSQMEIVDREISKI